MFGRFLMSVVTLDVMQLQKALATEQPISEASEAVENKSTEELWEIIRLTYIHQWPMLISLMPF